MGVTENISMKVLIFSTLVVLALASSVVTHETIKCMACGTRAEGPESPYSGVCSSEDDPGNSTECAEEFQSCMTAMITVHNTTGKHDDHDIIYLKNCAFTEVYHASGCLTVHDSDDVITFEGTMCYCDKDQCNDNFDANNNMNKPTTTPEPETTTANKVTTSPAPETSTAVSEIISITTSSILLSVIV